MFFAAVQFRRRRGRLHRRRRRRRPQSRRWPFRFFSVRLKRLSFSTFSPLEKKCILFLFDFRRHRPL